ncbi:hypothetical protein D3C75_1139230 [compost metagenome]
MRRQHAQQCANHHAQAVHGNIALVAAFADPPQLLRQRDDARCAPGQGDDIPFAQHRIGQQRQLQALSCNGIDETAHAIGADQR